MSLIQINQKTKIIFDAIDKTVEMDCYVEKIYYDRIALALPRAASRYNDFLKTSKDIKIKIFSYAGIILLDSIIINSPLEGEFTVEYDPDMITIVNHRKLPRYPASSELTIFRPLVNNIETRVIDMSTRGFRFYSELPLESGSEYDCKIDFQNSSNKILFKAQIQDNKGLPAGVYRMIISKIAYKDKQVLFDYCSELV